MDRPRMGKGKTPADSSLVAILLGVVLLLPFACGAAAAGKEDAITSAGHQSSFLYWVLDSSMWAIALYYILTRRAAFIELFQRYMVQHSLPRSCVCVEASDCCLVSSLG
jgi:hypothetical protein